MRLRFWWGKQSNVLRWILSSLLVTGLPLSGAASLSANLTWIASPDATVTGYNIYYGGVSHQYTNTVSVGNVTNVVISGLLENGESSGALKRGVQCRA